jgi:probable HAF family extracellular repeat protein
MPFLRLASLLLVTAILAGACRPRADQADPERPYAFTTLEYPGATATVASGINDAGDVVGWYVADEVMRGFLYRDGTYTSVEYPGAVRTQISGIGADGTLVGAYRLAGEPPVAFHPFLRTPAGEFRDLGHPDHAYGMIQRVLPDGTLIGCYHGDDTTSSMFAIAIVDGELTVYDVAGSMYTGATPDRSRMVGILAIEGRVFLAEGDRITHLEAPGSRMTEAWDMNAAGVIVGVQVDADETARGFVHENGRWTTIMVPESRTTIAFGINTHGHIVGGWEDANGTSRGYLATR